MMANEKKLEVIKGSIENILEILLDIYHADVAAIFLIVKDIHEDEKADILRERVMLILEQYRASGLPIPEVILPYAKIVDNRGLNGQSFPRSLLDEIDILKFCFREAQHQHPSINPDPQRDPPERLWKYSYKTRPCKYVIFKAHRDKSQVNSILYEGLTAYAVRTATPVLAPNLRELADYKCLSHHNARVGITPECKMVALFPLRDTRDNVIGLLKIEKYREVVEDRRNFTNDSSNPVKAVVENYLPLLVRLIQTAQQLRDKRSYENLYGVSPKLFLDNLGDSIIQQEKIIEKAVHQETTHLLHVLHRKEYAGYAETMQRITSYADDIAKDLGLSGNQFFQLLLEDRRRHEDLMLYETDGYRDHFMHSFNVFLTGYVILRHIGLDKVAYYANQSLAYAPDLYNGVLLDEESVLRIWFLSAFLHDATYVFEKLPEGLANFMKSEWGYYFKILPTGLDLLKTITVDSQGNMIDLPFSDYLQNLISFFSCSHGTNRGDILPPYLQGILNLSDHGVLSALWVIKKFYKEVSLKRVVEVYSAAFAISVHNSSIYRHLSENSHRGVTFECFPFAFLLAYCDTAQIWGRRSANVETEVEPRLVKINLGHQRIELEVTFIVKNWAKVPTCDHVRGEIIGDTNHYFRSMAYMFHVTFRALDCDSGAVQTLYSARFGL